MALLWLTSTIETAYNDPCALRTYDCLAAFSISNVMQDLGSFRIFIMAAAQFISGLEYRQTTNRNLFRPVDPAQLVQLNGVCLEQVPFWQFVMATCAVQTSSWLMVVNSIGHVTSNGCTLVCCDDFCCFWNDLYHLMQLVTSNGAGWLLLRTLNYP